LKNFKADLHVHTCLSPCADVGMSPRRIAEHAQKRGIDILGVCDHNSAENAAAVSESAARFGIRVLPGLEITSREEVHILALFEEVDAALSMQDEVYAHLAGDVDQAAFGPQVIADAHDVVLGFCRKLLLDATSFSLEGVVDHIRSRKGLAIAAHVDREAFGLVGQLGFIPDRPALDAIEISFRLSTAEARERYGAARPLIRSSDAHALEEIGRATTLFTLEAAAVEEIRMALADAGGRHILP
jgi:PHP family Zn ribbon phosphoesterase